MSTFVTQNLNWHSSMGVTAAKPWNCLVVESLSWFGLYCNDAPERIKIVESLNRLFVESNQRIKIVESLNRLNK